MGKHLRFTDAERCRLARKAHALGRKLLSELDTPVTPDTLLRWYRQLIARKWTYSRRPGPGRPHVMTTIVVDGASLPRRPACPVAPTWMPAIEVEDVEESCRLACALIANIPASRELAGKVW